MTIYAYARVSTEAQRTDRQIIAIKEYAKDIPDDNIFMDKASGKSLERPEYIRLKSMLRTGDELIIKEFDRLGRNKDEVMEELRWFKANGIIVRMLNIPTSLMDIPKSGKSNNGWVIEMVNNIIIEVYAAVAAEERAKILERTKEGIAAARSRGVYDNRKPSKPRKTVDPDLFETLYQQYQAKEIKQLQAAETLGLSPFQICRRFKEREAVGIGYNPNNSLTPDNPEAYNQGDKATA